MGWGNLIVAYHVLHNVTKSYDNAINDTTIFVEPTPPKNITTNETILTQYSSKQGLKVSVKNGKASVKK